jgi:hypothetical protein
MCEEKIGCHAVASLNFASQFVHREIKNKAQKNNFDSVLFSDENFTDVKFRDATSWYSKLANSFVSDQL